MPNNKILLMSSDYYKRNSVVNLNVEGNINIHIIKAQNMHIEKVLGTNLFKTLLSEVESGTVSSRMVTLLEDYIQPALVEWTTYVALPYFNYKVTNKAVVKKSSDNSESSELSELNFIRDDAEYYSNRITKFLLENETVYIEYNNGNDKKDDIKSNKNNFFSGIYLKSNTNYDSDCCDESDYR